MPIGQYLLYMYYLCAVRNGTQKQRLCVSIQIYAVNCWLLWLQCTQLAYVHAYALLAQCVFCSTTLICSIVIIVLIASQGLSASNRITAGPPITTCLRLFNQSQPITTSGQHDSVAKNCCCPLCSSTIGVPSLIVKVCV